jgi:hypothetical protein
MKSILLITPQNIERCNSDERDYFYRALIKISDFKEFAWLKKIDIQNIYLYWCYKMGLANGIIGCFSLFYPNRIFLSPQKNCKEFLISTLIHEVYHLYQYEKYGFVLFSLFSLPIIRNVLLERNARYYENVFDEKYSSIKF